MDCPRDERSSPRLSDEELEYFGDLYIRCGLRRVGLPFGMYLENPEYYLQKHARNRWRERPAARERRGLWRFFRLRAAGSSGPDQPAV